MVYKNKKVEIHCFNYRFQHQSSKRIPVYHEFSSHSGHTRNGQIYALLCTHTMYGSLKCVHKGLYQ